MALTNKRLKKYIYTSTTSVIRSRANQCSLVELQLSQDRNSVDAIVNGSSGTTYKLNFSGLLYGEIDSTCNCPFDHGNICKHEVYLANEVEGFFSEKVQLDENGTKPSAKNDKEFNAKDSYIIEMKDGYTINDLVRLNSHPNTYRSISIYESLCNVITNNNDFIHLQIPADYWRGSHKEVHIKKKGKQLTITCSCKAVNKKLCKHQAISLCYLDQYIPSFFISEEEENLLKENLLKEYGFTLDDETYKEYFNFGYDDKNLVAIPKKAGILKLHKNTNLSLFREAFLNPDGILKTNLPFEFKKEKKEKGFSLIFSPLNEKFSVFPVIGNINKDKTHFISKIEEVDGEFYISNKEFFSEKQSAIVENFLKLEHSTENTNINTEERLKFQFHTIKKIIKLVDKSVLTQRLVEYVDKVYPRDLEPITISKKHPRLFFKIKEETHFYLLKAFIEIDGKKLELKKNKYVQNSFCIHVKGEYYFYKSFYESRAFLNFNKEPEIRINKIDFETYNQEFIIPLAKQFEVIFLKRKYIKKKEKLISLKKQVYLSEQEDFITLQPAIEYKNEQYQLLTSQFIEEEKDGKFYKIERNQELETSFLEEIKVLHPSFEYQDENFFYLTINDFMDKGWFLDTIDVLKEKGIEVFGSDKLSKMKYNLHKPSISIDVNSGIDWFDVAIEISFGDQQVSLKDIRKSIVKKENYIQLKDGTIGVLPQQWVDKYSHVFRTGDVRKDSISVSKYQLSVIDSLYDILDATSEIAINHKQIKERFASFKEIETVKKPRGLKATLRDYQKEGLNWLNFLDDYNFGGCLADDMGLGKTLQIISFLKHLKNTKKPDNATLVVLPTSLIFNWQEEVKKFAPTLKYIVHTGGEREKTTEKFSTVDIIFTTYGVLMRDIDFIKEYTFNYCILDESQAIKNPNSQRFKAARLLKSNNKLVLTGTPIENNTFDLYAQMTFVNPGLLGTMPNFKKEYATPIDKGKDADAANDLRNLINPFLLRRTKEQVATELPPKTEQVLYCTMEKEQQKLYDTYKNKYRNYLLNKIDEEGLGKSKMYVLEGLTKLRQICDSPQLLNDEEKYTSESIKIQELLKHVTEKTGKHKILIFSQFVKMLNLVKKSFDKENIEYEYLDGRTKDRQAKVDNFQNNENVRVFLISLKAGGTGINLTAADYVYLLDPWWNPAVEAQAIDRCYRIGQTKKVMAYKMICKGTIEEKIMKYQESKKQLSADIIQTDESFVKALSKESITDLFQ